MSEDQKLQKFDVSQFKNNKFSVKKLLSDFQSEVSRIKENQNLKYLLNKTKLFEELVNHNLVDDKDIKFLFDSIEDLEEYKAFYSEAPILRLFLEKGFLSFQDLVDKFKQIGPPIVLLYHEEFMTQLIDVVSNEDLKYVLSYAESADDLDMFGELHDYNKDVLKHILKNFVLDEELIEKYNDIVQSKQYWFGSTQHFTTVFQLIDWYAKLSHAGINWYFRKDEDIDRELLRLNNIVGHLSELEFKNFKLTFDERKEMYDILKSDEQTEERWIFVYENDLKDFFKSFENLKTLLNFNEEQFENFKYIAENNVLGSFETFDDFLSYLTKSRKRNLLNI